MDIWNRLPNPIGNLPMQTQGLFGHYSDSLPTTLKQIFIEQKPALANQWMRDDRFQNYLQNQSLQQLIMEMQRFTKQRQLEAMAQQSLPVTKETEMNPLYYNNAYKQWY